MEYSWEIRLRNTFEKYSWIDSQLWDKLDKFLVGQLTNVAWGRGGGQWKIIDWPGCNKEEGYTTTLVLLQQVYGLQQGLVFLEEWYWHSLPSCLRWHIAREQEDNGSTYKMKMRNVQRKPWIIILLIKYCMKLKPSK